MEMVGWLTRSSNVNSAACLIFIGIAYPRKPSCRYGVFAPPGGQYQRLAVGAGKHRSVSIKYSVSCDKWPVFALLPPPFPSARQAAHSRQFAQISFPFSANSRDFSSIRVWEKQGERVSCLVRAKSRRQIRTLPMFGRVTPHSTGKGSPSIMEALANMKSSPPKSD
jgi:hypothetical protein